MSAHSVWVRQRRVLRAEGRTRARKFRSNGVTVEDSARENPRDRMTLVIICLHSTPSVPASTRQEKWRSSSCRGDRWGKRRNGRRCCSSWLSTREVSGVFLEKDPLQSSPETHRDERFASLKADDFTITFPRPFIEDEETRVYILLLYKMPEKMKVFQIYWSSYNAFSVSFKNVLTKIKDERRKNTKTATKKARNADKCVWRLMNSYECTFFCIKVWFPKECIRSLFASIPFGGFRRLQEVCAF